jgi:hypothetical protein
VHVVFDCSFATQVWQMAGLWDDVNHVVLTSDWDVIVIFYFLQTRRHEHAQQMTTIFWSIWKHQNLELWKDELCANVVDKEDWQTAKNTHSFQHITLIR